MKRIYQALLLLIIPTLAAAEPIARDAHGAPVRSYFVTDLNSLLDQTAAIVEGTVSKVDYEYTDERGPWTAYTLTNLVVHHGQLDNPQTLVIRQVGGWFPDGRMMSFSHITPLVKDARYLAFLRNSEWNLSPVLDQQIFRIEDVDGQENLIDPEGAPVTQIDDQGVRSSGRLFERVDMFGRKPARRQLDPSEKKPKGLNRGQFLKQLRDRNPKLRGRIHKEPTNKSSLIVPTAPAKGTP